LSGFLQSTGFVRAQDDSYSVVDFIRSRDAVKELVAHNNLKEILDRPEADFIMRFPNFWSEATDESLFKHYLRFIKISTDSSSGITSLEVRAFRPDDAYALARALVGHSEALINRLNDRARQDAIRYAKDEVAIAEKRLAEVQRRVTGFRNRETMVDPKHQSTTALDLVAKLASEAAAQKAQLREVERQAPQSPQIPALRTRIAATEQQISVERAKIVGSDGSMAPRIAQYEQLLLERDLAARMLDSSTTSLENAKIDAQRQQLYLERIVEPNVPDRALYPKSLYDVLLTLGIALATFAIVYILLVHIYEHADK
jgi:capsular polysaccharide transport system permease protein